MATKKAAERETTVERELAEVKEELRQEKKSCQALELDYKGLKVRVVALDSQLEEAERQKSIFKDRAAWLEGELSAATSQLNREREESQKEKAKLEGRIEGMERTMKILRRWGQPKRRRNR